MSTTSTKATLPDITGVDAQLASVHRLLRCSWGGRRRLPTQGLHGRRSRAASRSNAYYNQTSTHIAVLLLNGSRERTGVTDAKAQAGALALHCSSTSLTALKEASHHEELIPSTGTCWSQPARAI